MKKVFKYTALFGFIVASALYALHLLSQTDLTSVWLGKLGIISYTKETSTIHHSKELELIIKDPVRRNLSGQFYKDENGGVHEYFPLGVIKQVSSTGNVVYVDSSNRPEMLAEREATEAAWQAFEELKAKNRKWWNPFELPKMVYESPLAKKDATGKPDPGQAPPGTFTLTDSSGVSRYVDWPDKDKRLSELGARLRAIREKKTQPPMESPGEKKS